MVVVLVYYKTLKLIQELIPAGISAGNSAYSG